MVDEFVGREATQYFEPAAVVVGLHEQVQPQPVEASLMVRCVRYSLEVRTAAIEKGGRDVRGATHSEQQPAVHATWCTSSHAAIQPAHKTCKCTNISNSDH